MTVEGAKVTRRIVTFDPVQQFQLSVSDQEVFANQIGHPALQKAFTYQLAILAFYGASAEQMTGARRFIEGLMRLATKESPSASPIKYPTTYASSPLSTHSASNVHSGITGSSPD